MGKTKRNLQFNAYVAALLAMALATSGCFDLGMNGPNTAPVIKANSSQLVTGTAGDQINFFVTATASSTKNYATHRVSLVTNLLDPLDYTLPCRIDATGAATDDYCIVEAEEGDLHQLGAQLTYNIPGGVCAYARITPYWYFKWPVGPGPTSLTQTTHVNSSLNPSVVWSSSNGDGFNQQCKYDYRNQGGPNCCIGTYTYNQVTHDDVAGKDTGTVQTLNTPWGGDPSKCIGGPAVTTQAKDPSNQMPYPTTVAVAMSGATGTYSIPAPQGKYLSNVPIANFYDPSYHTGGLPAALQPVSLVDAGSPKAYNFTSTPQDSYMFECLDGSLTLKHRIRLYIREWNQRSDLNTFVGGSVACPYTTGTDSFGKNINDYSTWGDFENPGYANCGAPGAVTPTYPELQN